MHIYPFLFKIWSKKNQIRLIRDKVNTEAKVNAVKQLIQNTEQKILLVTSELGMYLARKVFEKVGFNVILFPLGSSQSEGSLNSFSFITSSYALEETISFVIEIIGQFYHTFK